MRIVFMRLITLHSPLKKVLHLTLAITIVLSSPLQSFAWSDKAHRIIAALAWMKLSESAKRQVRELLPGTSLEGNGPLAEISMWADLQRGPYPEERRWHFVAIPLSAESYDMKRDCADGNCIVVKLNEKKELLRTSQNRQIRADALKYVVHLVGDLYQPLHVTDNNDQGGNMVQVKFQGKLTNLHQVWDSEMINRSELDVASYVKKLSELSVPRGFWIDSWVQDSHGIAQQYVYAVPKDRELGTTYYRRNLPVLEMQLATAAEKLAEILNDNLKPLTSQETLKGAPTKATNKARKPS
jgi:hypothetical protein